MNGPSWYKYNPNLWFRGHPEIGWQLLPKVERQDFIESAKKAGTNGEDYERTIFRQFIIRAPHLLPPNAELTDKYFLAQHHGLPTRLLDWSTNPLVGLFFAAAKDSDKDGRVFVMYSRDGTEESFGDVVYQDDENVTKCIQEIYKGGSEEENNVYPLRIIPNAQHGRILSQASRFTLHPIKSKKLEELNNIIFSYNILSKNKVSIMEELSVLNVNWSTLFPDIDHIVKEIKFQAKIE